jgi:tetratricopeptide (TPR) repeat protein
MGRNLLNQDEGQRAVRLVVESLERMRELDDLRGIAFAEVSLSDVWLDQGDMGRAMVHIQAALTCYEALHDDGFIPWLHMILGKVAQRRGDLRRAATIFEEVLTSFSRHDDRHGLGHVLWCLGRLEQELGDVEGAARRFRAGLMVERDLGKEVSGWLEALASVAVGRGQVVKAVRLLGAAAAERQVHGEPSRLDKPTECVQEVTTAGMHLTAVAWGSAWAEGRTMALEQAIAYALDEAGPE